ncbi:hypothetical protein ACB098_03G036900 [Castanea mollissima]
MFDLFAKTHQDKSSRNLQLKKLKSIKFRTKNIRKTLVNTIEALTRRGHDRYTSIMTTMHNSTNKVWYPTISSWFIISRFNLALSIKYSIHLNLPRPGPQENHFVSTL